MIHSNSGVLLAKLGKSENHSQPCTVQHCGVKSPTMSLTCCGGDRRKRSRAVAANEDIQGKEENENKLY